MANYLIDVGSKSIKIYKKNNFDLAQIEKISYSFSTSYPDGDFDDLTDLDKQLLYELFNNIKVKYDLSKSNTKLYSTGHFRRIIKIQQFIADFYTHTGLYFNVISHELEAHYLAPILQRFVYELGNTILINIGGDSVEILFCIDGKLCGKPYIPQTRLGANELWQNRFPLINIENNKKYLFDAVDYVTLKLRDETETYETAIYTGGELSFMRLLGYPLTKNTFFCDRFHPCYINTADYYKHNEKLYEKFTIDELYGMMPQNPKWMDGARACSAIAQAICQKYGVKRIIPSDLNLIDGICVQDARSICLCGVEKSSPEYKSLISLLHNKHIEIFSYNGSVDANYVNLYSFIRGADLLEVDLSREQSVVLCGSFNKHLDKIVAIANRLKNKKISVLSPQNTEVVGCYKEFVLFEKDKMINNCKWSIEIHHLQAIEKCDYVVICNFDNYVGVSTAIEIGYALRCKKTILFADYQEELLLREPNFRAIEECDYVIVCNYNNHLSISTAIEVGYALKCGKRIIFAEDNEVAQNIDGPFEIGLFHL